MKRKRISSSKSNYLICNCLQVRVLNLCCKYKYPSASQIYINSGYKFLTATNIRSNYKFQDQNIQR